jgi:hypothetical protein
VLALARDIKEFNVAEAGPVIFPVAAVSPIAGPALRATF